MLFKIMTFLRLDSLHVKLGLREFSKLLSESVGPCGKTRLLQSTGGQLTITSSSRRLLTNLVFDNPIFLFIVQAIQSHINRYEDGGLFCGILLSTLYYNLISSEMPLLPVQQLLASFCSAVQSELKRGKSSLHLKVSLDTVRPLLYTVRTVMRSKPSVLPTRGQRLSDPIPFLLVRSFLDAGGHIGQVKLKVTDGSFKPELLDGVLYTCIDNEHMLFDEQWISVPVIVVTTMLSDRRDANEEFVAAVEDSWNGDAQLKAAQALVALAAVCGIRVIACQRVIHPSLLITMRRHGILALQRLGTQFTDTVTAMSGATPISSLKLLTTDSISCFKGCLNDIKHVKLAEKDYLLMSSSMPMKTLTLFLCSPSPESATELEVVACQALHALRHAVEDGVLIPGAGCSEMYICSFLSYETRLNQKSLCEKHKCTLVELRTAVLWLQIALLRAVGLDSKTGTVAVDSVYHHAWKSTEQEPLCLIQNVCCCGVLSKDDVVQFQGRWQKISTVNIEPMLPINWCHNPKTLSQQSQEFRLGTPDIVLDVLSSKYNAFTLALENCLGLCDVGALVQTAKH